MWLAIRNYFAEFKILKQTPKEFWTLNLVINFFEMLAYFAFITVLTLYLTDNLGFNDTKTGDIVGYFTLAITVIIFFAGPIIDWIGIKKSLIISMAILIPTRLFLGLTDTIEFNVVKNNLIVDEVLTEVNQTEAWKKAFTFSQEQLVNAQIGIVISQSDEPNKTILVEQLKTDTKALRDKLLTIFGSSDYARKIWSDKLQDKMQADWSMTVSEAAKDINVFKEMLITLIEDNPDLKTKYFYNLDHLQGEELKTALTKIIIAVPELREKFSINSILQLLVLITLAFIAIGEALMVPAIYVAVRRFTNKKTSGAGFNFQYLTMNIGAVLSYVVFDYMRITLGNLAGNSAILIACAICALICTLTAIIMRAAIEVKDDGQIIKHKSEKELRATTNSKENPIAIIKSVVQESAFWRFMLFILLLIGVKLVFTHQFMVMPKYYQRVLGPDAPIGILNGVNPAIIVAGLILFIPLISRFSVFRLIVVGTFISAGSVFFLIIPGKTFSILNWSIENGYFALILAQVIVFAVGELIWSPRLSEYTVVIAPKGREGTYMSLAALPMFIAQPFNGMLSGRLLDNYCPSDVLAQIAAGTRTFWNGPEMMWLIFGLISISSPIGVLLFKKVICKGNTEI